MVEYVLGNPVVEHALAVDDFVFLLVESGGIILEELDQRARLWPLIEDLGLAFINAAAIFHLIFLWICGQAASDQFLSVCLK
jgi:hypothetical protein